MGELQIRCRTCQQRHAMSDAHVISTSNGSGRAWRCNPCGDLAVAAIRRQNIGAGA